SPWAYGRTALRGTEEQRMRIRLAIFLTVMVSAVGLVGSGPVNAATPSKNFVGGGGVVAACEPVLPGCTSGLNTTIGGLGVSGNADGTNVRGAITFSATLTTGPS